MRSFELKMHQIHFPPGLGPGARWGAYDAPQTSGWLWRGILSPDTPSPRRLRCLDLGAFGAPNSVPIFCWRRMVTLSALQNTLWLPSSFTHQLLA